jgi:Family of unknown function (DUF6101)
MAGGLPAGSSRAFRLDPTTLPVRFSAAIGGIAPEAAIVLDRERAVVRRPMRSGPPITFAVPVSTYDGVAVRMEAIGTEGELRVTVELLHRDPGLSLPLIVASEPEDVAEDWQAWGRALNLPLLLVGENGRVDTPIKKLGALTIGRARVRRRHSLFKGRRPRFLRRRKTGWFPTIERLTFREIIARN